MRDLLDVEIVGGRKRKKRTTRKRKSSSKKTRRSSRRRTRRKKADVMDIATEGALIAAGVALGDYALGQLQKQSLSGDDTPASTSSMTPTTASLLIAAAATAGKILYKPSAKVKKYSDPILLGMLAFGFFNLYQIKQLESLGIGGTYSDWMNRTKGGISYSIPYRTPDIQSSIV